MTWKDKLEIGLKDDARFRRDNVPDFQKEPGGPETQPGDPSRSPEQPIARRAAATRGGVSPMRKSGKAQTTRLANERLTRRPGRKRR